MIRGRGGAMFFPLCKLLFSLVSRNKLFFPLRQRNTQFCPLRIASFFCKFCEQTFYLLQFTEPRSLKRG